jgi:thiol-disulfide isomerase/thioredoxin
MAETPSTMLALGTPLPAFSLTDAARGRLVTDREAAGPRATLVMFICNHCPFVQHVLAELGRVAADYAPRGVGIVAVNSNDVVGYPQDGPEHMKELANTQGWRFPFLFDQDQTLAKALQAACTPDFFLFDGERRLAYRGRLDESRPGSNVPVTGRDLRAALDAILSGRPVNAEQRASVGCNIKWKVSVG